MSTKNAPLDALGDFRDLLRAQFTARSQKNRRYSMRSFARDLGVSPATLSETMSGRHVPSAKTASQIALALKWSAAQKQLFLDLVQAEHPRSRRTRESARSRIDARSQMAQESTLSAEVVRVISDWYHYGILELTQTLGFQRSPTWIGRALGIPPAQAETAVQRLLQLRLLAEKDGRLIPTSANTTTTDDVPSTAIRQFHRQILTKATAALEEQTVVEREIKSMIVSIPRAALPELRDVLRRFFEGFKERTILTHPKEELYGFSMQFFRLQSRETPADCDD